MFGKLFWVLAALLAALVTLYAAGWPVLSIIAALLVADLAIVQLGSRKDFKLIYNDMRHELLARFDNVEKLCNNIATSVQSNREEILAALNKGVVSAPPAEAAPAETATEEAVIEATDAVDESKPAEPAAGFTVQYEN